MILMPFPYCEKCHLHWLTFMLTIAWIKPKIWTSCILYHAQRDCLHCICCYGATSKQRGESWSSSNLKQLLVQRDRDYKERNLTKTSTLFCSPKVLPGVMNSRAAWTVAAPKEWKLKILKFVSVFKAVGGTVWTKGTWHYEGQFVQQQVHISRTWAQLEIGFQEGVHPHNNNCMIFGGGQLGPETVRCPICPQT